MNFLQSFSRICFSGTCFSRKSSNFCSNFFKETLKFLWSYFKVASKNLWTNFKVSWYKKVLQGHSYGTTAHNFLSCVHVLAEWFMRETSGISGWHRLTCSLAYLFISCSVDACTAGTGVWFTWLFMCLAVGMLVSLLVWLLACSFVHTLFVVCCPLVQLLFMREASVIDWVCVHVWWLVCSCLWLFTCSFTCTLFVHCSLVWLLFVREAGVCGKWVWHLFMSYQTAH